MLAELLTERRLILHLTLCLCLQVSDTETRLECLLNNNKNSDFCAPLTSFDWNEVDPNLLGKAGRWRTCAAAASGTLF